LLTKVYRNEWKYRLQEADLSVIEGRLRGIMGMDSHSDNDTGEYQVHSLYFDDYKDSCAKENEAGVAERFKYRIRYYGTNSDFLKLERKEKLDGMCHKVSTLITRDEYHMIMEGKAEELYWESDDEVLRKFCILMMTRLFKPKLIVDYDRVAYVDEITNVRITFDKNISVSEETSEFLDGVYLAYPVQEHREHVLEVKFDSILPGYIKSAITNKNLQQSSFSKYYLGRLKIQNMRGH
jgi:hypothetical protein